MDLFECVEKGKRDSTCGDLGVERERKILTLILLKWRMW
jgi:hypothetical protein